MLELKFGGVKKISGQGNYRPGFGADLTWRAVECVPCHWVAERSHVDANLMSAASFDFDFDQCEFAEFGLNSSLNNILRDGLTATASACGHADSTNGITADWAGNCAMI